MSVDRGGDTRKIQEMETDSEVFSWAKGGNIDLKQSQ
jgi:hypothetical protein